MSTTGNRVCVNSAPRVQIPNSPPRGFSPHYFVLSPSILGGGAFFILRRRGFAPGFLAIGAGLPNTSGGIAAFGLAAPGLSVRGRSRRQGLSCSACAAGPRASWVGPSSRLPSLGLCPPGYSVIPHRECSCQVSFLGRRSLRPRPCPLPLRSLLRRAAGFGPPVCAGRRSGQLCLLPPPAPSPPKPPSPLASPPVGAGCQAARRPAVIGHGGKGGFLGVYPRCGSCGVLSRGLPRLVPSPWSVSSWPPAGYGGARGRGRVSSPPLRWPADANSRRGPGALALRRRPRASLVCLPRLTQLRSVSGAAPSARVSACSVAGCRLSIQSIKSSAFLTTSDRDMSQKSQYSSSFRSICGVTAADIIVFLVMSNTLYPVLSPPPLIITHSIPAPLRRSQRRARPRTGLRG